MQDTSVKPSRKAVNLTIIVVIAIIVFAISLSATSFFVVDQTEEAVLLTFGKYTKTLGPGLHFKFPFGIQRNYNVKTKTVQTAQFGFRTEKADIVTKYSDATFLEESRMLTGDLNIVDVEWIIQFRIVDPKAWVFNVDNRTKTIRDISQSVMNLLVGDRKILDIMGQARDAIQEEATAEMNRIFKNYNIGIQVIAVRLQNIVPLSEVQAAFEDVNKAIQDMNRLINEGKEAYNKEIPRARGEADKIKQIAMGYATERVNKANGDVARFISVFNEYVKAPDITRTRLYYEMMEIVFGSNSSVDVIDSNLGNFLPLKNLTTTPQGAKQ